MSHVVGTLLLHITAPFDSFRMFTNLVLTETMYEFYKVNYDFISSYFKVFWKLLKDICPKLCTSLSKQQCSGNLFLLGWVNTLFSHNLQIAVAGFAWDQILLYGELQIMRIALAICHAVYRKVSASLKEEEQLAMVDWLAVVQDPGLHIKSVVDLQESLRQVHRKVNRDLIKDLLR